MNENEIVKIANGYNSTKLLQDVLLLKKKYSFLEIGSIGKSVLKKDIPCISFGNGTKEVMFSGAIHSNEWITALLLMKFIEWLAYSYSKQNDMCKKYTLNSVFANKKIYFIPMVNPDGVDLLTNNLTYEQVENMRTLSNNYPDIPFPNGWKANYNGVNLNLQFPACWDKAKDIKVSRGCIKPGPQDYAGENPLTEPEALALYEFTLKHDFQRVIAYHTQGQVIYHQYLDMLPEGTLDIANEMSRLSGYVYTQTPYASSFAGYKDWFIQEYNRPGFTVEAGIGKNPLPISQFQQIYEKNFDIIITAILL